MIELLPSQHITNNMFSNKDLKTVELKLEDTLKELLNVPFLLLTSSGTAAIHLALEVLGDGLNKVFTSSSSFIASAHPVLYVNKGVDFGDINSETWQLDESLCSSYLDRNKNITTVIIPNNYGVPVEQKTFNYFIERGITIIEDNAAGFASQVEGKYSGTLGDFGVFSFNSNKIISGYGGGALAFKREEDYLKAKRLIQHGRLLTGKQYLHDAKGFNYKISVLSVQMILEQLKSLKGKLLRKKEVNEFYKNKLEGKGFVFQSIPDNIEWNCWLNTIRHDHFSKPIDEILDLFLENGIQLRRAWFPLEKMAHLKNDNQIACEVSNLLFDTGISIPSGELMSKNEQDKVIQLLEKVIQ